MSEAMRFVGKSAAEAREDARPSATITGAERVIFVVAEIVRELDRAMSIHGSVHSPHEGYAVILEELDELWDLVKAYPKRADVSMMREEPIQVAAMALRFVLEVCKQKTDATL